MLSNLSELPQQCDSLTNILKGRCEGRIFPAVRLGLSHVLHPLPKSFWRCFFLVSNSFHTHSHCPLPVFPGHSGSLGKIKNMSYPGKVSERKTVTISLCMRNHPLHNRKHLIRIQCTQRVNSLKNYFATDADSNRNIPFCRQQYHSAICY